MRKDECKLGQKHPKFILKKLYFTLAMELNLMFNLLTFKSFKGDINGRKF